jgi:hypothetical protein
MEPFEVVDEAHQSAFGGHFRRPAQQESAQGQDGLGDSEDRFDRLSLQLVELLAGGALQPVPRVLTRTLRSSIASTASIKDWAR